MDSSSYIIHLFMFLCIIVMFMVLGLGIDKQFSKVENKIDRIIATQQATTTTQPVNGGN